ncbi:hypothetical protein K3495_g3578 [Podosphaera aphanis]|nr:hypothetical protein K3495_g3578 [Podosphaera aphanis]
MRSGNAKLRFSNADDIGILEFGPTIAESAAVAQREVDHLLQRRETAVGVPVNGTFIEPAEHIRWLGVHLDPRLNFKHHTTTWCGKAIRAAQQMRRFNSTYRGAAPKALHDQQSHIDGLTGSSPGDNDNTECSSALRRLKTLDDKHPLRSRAAICPNDETKKFKKKHKKTARPELQMSRLQRAYRQLPEAEPAAPLPEPLYLSKLDTKEPEVETSKRLIDSLSSAEICAYPDD